MTKINKNIQKLITLMKNKGVDYYLVGTTDEFLNEYVPYLGFIEAILLTG